MLICYMLYYKPWTTHSRLPTTRILACTNVAELGSRNSVSTLTEGSSNCNLPQVSHPSDVLVTSHSYILLHATNIYTTFTKQWNFKPLALICMWVWNIKLNNGLYIFVAISCCWGEQWRASYDNLTYRRVKKDINIIEKLEREMTIAINN